MDPTPDKAYKRSSTLVYDGKRDLKAANLANHTLGLCTRYRTLGLWKLAPRQLGAENSIFTEPEVRGALTNVQAKLTFKTVFRDVHPEYTTC